MVKATILVTESGFAGIQDAIAYGEIKKDESITGRSLKLSVYQSSQYDAR